MNYFPIKCHFFAVILDLPFYSLLSGPLRETARSQSDSTISTEQLALPRTHTHTHVAYFSLPEFPSPPLPDSQYIPLSSLSGFTHTHRHTYIHTYTHRKRRNQREQLIKVTSRYHQLLLSSCTHEKHGTSKKGNENVFISSSFPLPSLLLCVLGWRWLSEQTDLRAPSNALSLCVSELINTTGETVTPPTSLFLYSRHSIAEVNRRCGEHQACF